MNGTNGEETDANVLKGTASNKRGRKKSLGSSGKFDKSKKPEKKPLEESAEDFEEDITVCEACLDGTVYEENEILFCDRCNVPVHQNCCNVGVIPEGPWFCDVCTFEIDPKTLPCELCSNFGGVYKLTEKPNKWAHILCSVWIPEIYEVAPQIDTKTVEGRKTDIRHLAHLNLSYLDKKRYKLKCALCSSKGACIQCCAGRCTTAAHPWCVVKNPKGFTRRIIKNDEGALVWEIFCKGHAKSVNEPYKPRTKAKMSIAINLGDQQESQPSADFDASEDYWPSTIGNDEDDGYVPSKSKNPRKSTGNKQNLWSDNSSSQVGQKIIENSSSSVKENKAVDRANDEKNLVTIGETLHQQMQFPILSFLEWPGQSEGEGMDLDHFWNVVSSYFVEDHSLEWMEFMLDPFRASNRQWDSADRDSALITALHQKPYFSNTETDENMRTLMSMPPLGKPMSEVSASVWQDMVDAADEKLAVLGSDKEKFAVFDKEKRTSFFAKAYEVLQKIDKVKQMLNDVEEVADKGQNGVSNDSVQQTVNIGYRDSELPKPSTDDKPVLIEATSQIRFPPFAPTECNFLQDSVFVDSLDESAVLIEKCSLSDASHEVDRTMRVIFDGYNRVGCDFTVTSSETYNPLSAKNMEVNEEWVASHILPISNQTNRNFAICPDVSLAVESFNTFHSHENVTFADSAPLISEDYDDDLCRAIRTCQVAYAKLTNAITDVVEGFASKAKMSEAVIQKQTNRIEWKDVEQLYSKQQIWKQVSNGVKRGFKDQLPDFNRGEEENLPASWTIKVDGRPAPAKDEDDKEIHEDAVCMSCFDGTSNDDNKILFCDGCNASVHQVCYGVSEIPEGDFYCDRCKYVKILYESEDPRIASSSSSSQQYGSSADGDGYKVDFMKVKSVVMCCLCPLLHGAIKPTSDGRWVHLCCALWTGGAATIQDLTEMSPIDVSNVPISSGSYVVQPCLYCGIYGGFLASCSHGTFHAPSDSSSSCCSAVFHPICAWFEGAFVSAEIEDPTFQGGEKNGIYPSGLKFTFLCQKHSPEMRINAQVTDEQHALRSKYRIVEEDLEQIPGKNKRRRHKKKKKVVKESVGRISAGVNAVRDLNKDVYDDKVCAICFNPMEKVSLKIIKDNVDTTTSSTAAVNPEVGVYPEKLSCIECSVTVHGDCFVGEMPSSDAIPTWRCNSCRERTEECPNIKCTICPRTGGFLLPTTELTWAHVYCARTAPGLVVILPAEGNYCVDIRSIPKEMKKQKCIVCNRKNGACLKCNHLGCNNFYHALCGARSGKAFIRTRMGLTTTHCFEHIPEGVERQRGGYWVDGQELQLLRYSLDRARLITDILNRRERCKRMLCKVEMEMFTLGFPRILDKAKGRRLKNISNDDVDMSDFSLDESDDESEENNNEEVFIDENPKVSGRRGRPKMRKSVSTKEDGGGGVYEAVPTKQIVQTAKGDVEISTTWMSSRKNEVRLPKKLHVGFAGLEFDKKDFFPPDGGKTYCKDKIVENVEESRPNTRIFENYQAESAFVASLTNQLRKHISCDEASFFKSMTHYGVKVPIETKNKPVKRGYVILEELDSHEPEEGKNDGIDVDEDAKESKARRRIDNIYSSGDGKNGEKSGDSLQRAAQRSQKVETPTPGTVVKKKKIGRKSNKELEEERLAAEAAADHSERMEVDEEDGGEGVMVVGGPQKRKRSLSISSAPMAAEDSAVTPSSSHFAAKKRKGGKDDEVEEKSYLAEQMDAAVSEIRDVDEDLVGKPPSKTPIKLSLRRSVVPITAKKEVSVDVSELQPAPETSSKFKKKVKLVEEEPVEDKEAVDGLHEGRYSFRKSAAPLAATDEVTTPHTKKIKSPRPFTASTTPAKATTPVIAEVIASEKEAIAVSPVSVVPEIPFVFMHPDAIKSSLEDSKLFGPLLLKLDAAASSGHHDYTNCFSKLAWNEKLDPSVLLEYAEYSPHTLYILERQIQDIIREIETYTIEQAQQAKQKRNSKASKAKPSLLESDLISSPLAANQIKSSYPGVDSTQEQVLASGVEAIDQSNSTTKSDTITKPTTAKKSTNGIEKFFQRIETRHKTPSTAMEEPTNSSLTNAAQPSRAKKGSKKGAVIAEVNEDPDLLVEEFVDIPYDTIPDYNSHVRKVVSMEILNSNLTSHQYITMAAFCQDVYTMFNNARAVTKKNSTTWQHTSLLAFVFEEVKSKIVSTCHFVPINPSDLQIANQQHPSLSANCCCFCGAAYPAESWPEGFEDLAVEAVVKSNDEAEAALRGVSASPQIRKKRKSGGPSPGKKSSSVATPSKDTANSSGSFNNNSLSVVKHRLLEFTANAAGSEGQEEVQETQKKLLEWICAECVKCKNSAVLQRWGESRLQADSSSSSCSSSSSGSSSIISSSSVSGAGSRWESPVEAHLKEVSAAVAAANQHELLHRRVFVWWQDDSCCYGGLVDAFDPFTRRHRVLYDDGEWEFIDLASEPVLFVCGVGGGVAVGRSV